MESDRRQEVLRLYHLALARDEEDRTAFLADACEGDGGLRHEVESLLAQEPPSDFLGTAPGAGGLNPASDSRHSLIGRHIGPYRVDAKIGSGGMGDVFRAHDTTLRRDVAIKTLPPAFAGDPERLARFEREARVLATLNHPHIGAIYGVERTNGVPALVLELVEGETLAERLHRNGAARGARMSVNEAVAIARQIAEALEAAHDKGIIHRDLKPGNVKFAADGSVKVLDFGLAKLLSSSLTERVPAAATSAHPSTETGAIMGTAAYMSPEQAKGERVDKRCDIWAFGCILFEMLAGRPAFAKATMAETVGAVLHREPDWTAVPGETPDAVRMALERCLQKDSRNRLRDMGDVQLALTGALSSSSASGVRSTLAGASPTSMLRRALPLVASVLAGALVTGVAMRRGAAPDARNEPTRLSINARGIHALHVNGNEQELAITPDGSHVVYVGDEGRRIFARALNQLEPVTIATGSVFRNPFVSPDGQWVGYAEGVGGGSLWKVPISDGPPVRIAPGSFLRGAVWLEDGTIVFGTGDRANGLQRVSAQGGVPATLTTPDPARNEYDHYWPAALPDGRGILYTVLARTGGLGAARIAVYDLETRQSTDLLTGGTNAVYVPSGHLAYVAGETLWAAPFDAGRRSITGTAVPVLKLSAMTGTGAGNIAVSATGTLAYAHAPGFDPFARTLSWIDRSGKLEPLGAPQHPYTQLRLSHDGTRVVYATGRTPDNNPWVLDLPRLALTRLRTEASRDQEPSWSHDDRWVLFSSDRAATGVLQIWRQAADGSGEPELLVEKGSSPVVSPDGMRLVFTAETSPPGNIDVLEMSLDGSRRVRGLVQTPFNEQGGEISPDGRWLAYHSNVSGRQEVWVRPYPDTASGRWQVSTAGAASGRSAKWRRDGRELFYMAPDGSLMGARVTGTGSTWTATSPVKVLDPGYWSREALIFLAWDVAPDGKRFLVVTPPTDQGDPPDLVVIQHWDEELKARVPVK
jgi:serine/threonine-protein kinase